jgi:hypothetical protein
VTWHQPEEVIFCAGRDTRRDGASVFPGIAIRRFAHMAKAAPVCDPDRGIVEVHRSCVLTLFEFDGDQSRIHYLLPGRGTLSIGRRTWRAPVALMRTLTTEEFRSEMLGQTQASANPERLSITQVYDYLEQLGGHLNRRNTVMAFEQFGHAYWSDLSSLDQSNTSDSDSTRTECGCCLELRSSDGCGI